MSKVNIVLIGFMAAGKSLVSQDLAQKLGRTIFSTDELIEEKEGRSIIQIFEQEGEEYFRQVETDVVRQVSQMEEVIIDCGGGIIKTPLNVTLLKETGQIFWLLVDPAVVLNRIKLQPIRPLLDVPDPLAKINELLAERFPLYKASADHLIDSNDDDITIAADHIIQIIKRLP